MFGVLINVGSSASEKTPNGRGRIFDDYRFEYLPIPEKSKIIEKVPSYRELGFLHVRFSDLPVHLDPEFETFTYGHVERGYGDVKNLLRLGKDDVLFFCATLQKGNSRSYYIIGYFKSIKIYDCRRLATNEIFILKNEGFSNNAHLKRADPHVDILVKGGEGSGLLEKAFPLSKENNNRALAKPLEDIVLTATGKRVKPGTPWFRWTLISSNAEKLLGMIEMWQKP